MTELTTEFFAGHGGAQLALHRMGKGRPVVLLHGLFSSAAINWVKFGTARAEVRDPSENPHKSKSVSPTCPTSAMASSASTSAG